MTVMSGRLDSFIKAIIFPRPKVASYDTSSRPNHLVHVPLVDPLCHDENGRFTFSYLIVNPQSTHLLLYAHPNGVDIGMAYKELRYVSKEACVSVLLFEYSGYGLTSTPITEASIHGDTLSAYLFARRYLGVPANRMIFCGRSLGASAAAFLAVSLPPSEQPCLLILQCPFTALSECIHEFSQNAVSIANFLGYNWFRTIDIIADVKCPVVLHHGTHDTVVRISHSYTLQRARDSDVKPCVTYLYQEDGKGHNNLSSDVLVRIITERVVNDELPPLHFGQLKLFMANPPMYKRLFCDDLGKPLATVDDVMAMWATKLSFDISAPTLEHLYEILTASVCVFTMQCTRHWQVYCALIKKNACREAEREKCTKEDFLLRCLACLGSPTGIHISVDHPHSAREMRVFGFTTSCDAHPKTPPLYSSNYTDQPMTVMEVAVTPGLLSCMKRCLSTAPDVSHGRPIPCFVQPELVNAIQLECERAIGFLSHDDRARLGALLRDRYAGCSTVMSKKAWERLQHRPSKVERESSESFDELREWLRPWLSTRNTNTDALAHEVPWDDYLLRGRSLVAAPLFDNDKSWEECCQALAASDVVLSIYRLFREMSQQYLRPSFVRSL